MFAAQLFQFWTELLGDKLRDAMKSLKVDVGNVVRVLDIVSPL